MKKEDNYNNKKKVLVFGLSNNVGGIETFYFEYYKNFDFSKFQIDFAVIGKKIAFENEFLLKNSKVFKLPSEKKHPIKYCREIKKILKNRKYDIVHYNMLSAANILPLVIAKKMEVERIIAHSHNSNIPKGILRKILHCINKKKIFKYANEFLACSDNAGKWLFNGKKFSIVKNVIDINRFIYDEKLRITARKEMQLEEKFIIGHIGRFSEQKNQKFIIYMFAKLIKDMPNAYLIMVGNGNKKKILKLIDKLNLKKYISIIEATNETEKFYNIFDVFILPSKFEGLPIVALEAQSCELPCILSKNISSETKINRNVEFLPIDDYEQWIEAIKKIGNGKKYMMLRSKIFEKEFTVDKKTNKLQQYYLDKNSY